MKRVPLIDLIRFGAITVVIGSHFYPAWIASFFPGAFLKGVVETLFSNGLYGVSCFFVVSGYLITQMLAQGRTDLGLLDLKSFYVRRAARILPLLLLVTFVGFSGEQFVPLLPEALHRYDPWAEGSHFGWLFWSSLMTFNFNWYAITHSTSTGGHWLVLWSLAVEEQFYFGYPWLLKVSRQRGRVVPLLGAIVLFGVFFRWLLLPTFDQNPFWMHQSSFGSFDQLALGALLYFAVEKLGRNLRESPGAAWALFGTGLMLLSVFYFGTRASVGIQYIFAPTGVALGAALALLGGFHLDVFNAKPFFYLSWPGKLSYGGYVWHSTVLFLFLPFFFKLGGFWGLLVLIAAVLFFSWVSYRFYEVPMNHFIRRSFGLAPSTSE